MYYCTIQKMSHFGTDRWITEFTLSQAKSLQVSINTQDSFHIVIEVKNLESIWRFVHLKWSDLFIKEIKIPSGTQFWLNCTIVHNKDTLITNCPNKWRHIPRSCDNNSGVTTAATTQHQPGWGAHQPNNNNSTQQLRLLKAAVICEQENRIDR